jgi:hypothetical protein
MREIEMQKNRRGFIFTVDAVSAAAFLVVLLSVAFVVVDYKPALTHADAHFAPDVLAALDDGKMLDDAQVRQLFLQVNKCGSIMVQEAGAEGKVVDAAYACNCGTGTESVAYRSFVRVGEMGAFEPLLAEAHVCERSGA